LFFFIFQLFFELKRTPVRFFFVRLRKSKNNEFREKGIEASRIERLTHGRPKGYWRLSGIFN